MQRHKASNEASSGTGRPSSPAPAPPAAGSPGQVSAGGNALLHRKYRELIRKHLGQPLDGLFADFIGVHFHVAWAPAPPALWDTRSLPTGCSVCCRLTRSPLLPDCRACGPKQLARALDGDGEGQRFVCRLGVRNYWVPIRVRGETLGLAYLQALAHSIATSQARKRSHQAGRDRLDRTEARVLSRRQFARAVRFLQHIVEHVQTASLADLRKADLMSAGRAVLALEKEQARLHETLQRHLPLPPKVTRGSEPESHAERIVHRLLERMNQDYRKPITLQQCARELGMNNAYVSALFSRGFGVPFKTRLTELRIDKAKELLGDPAKAASEVAFAVGYASENRFRVAFKKATGLSPKLWRETMQTRPPKPSPSG